MITIVLPKWPIIVEPLPKLHLTEGQLAALTDA